MQAGITYCTIIGNTCFSDEVSPSQRRGILLTGAGIDYNTVVGNTVYGNSVNQIEQSSNIGTHNVIHSNAGDNLSNANIHYSKLPDSPIKHINTINNATAINVIQTGLTSTSNSATSNAAIKIDNTSNTGHGLAVYTNTGTGALAPLVDIKVDNVLWDYATSAMNITNNSTQTGFKINQVGELTANRGALHLLASGNQTQANVYGLLVVQQASTGTTNRAVWVDHAGTGEAIQARNTSTGKVLILTKTGASGTILQIDNSGTGLAIDSRVGGVSNFTVDSIGVVKSGGYKSADGSAGVSGSFTTTDGKTITIKNGIVTAIL